MTDRRNGRSSSVHSGLMPCCHLRPPRVESVPSYRPDRTGRPSVPALASPCQLKELLGRLTGQGDFLALPGQRSLILELRERGVADQLLVAVAVSAAQS